MYRVYRVYRGCVGNALNVSDFQLYNLGCRT